MTATFMQIVRSGKPIAADGAIGTNLQQRGLSPGQAPEEWVLDRPDEITKLHREFVEAGAHIILTCTFGGTRMRLAFSGLEGRVAEVNTRAVECARAACVGSDVLIAGSLGPLGNLLQPLGEVSEDECRRAYAEQAQALARASVDLLVVETQFDLKEARCAIQSIRDATELPLVVSFSYDQGTRTMMGHSPIDVARALTDFGVDMIGINCGKSLEQNLANMREMRAATHLPLWMKPNAGIPRLVDLTTSVYDVTPDDMGSSAREWISSGATVCGGCCGTSPTHVKEIVRSVRSV